MRKTIARVFNRALDAAGRAAGYCMADTWQPWRSTFAPGHADWRCWLPAGHYGPWHRTGHYRWRTDGQPVFDVPGAGFVARRPGWLPRHRDVASRRRERVARLRRTDVAAAQVRVMSEQLGRAGFVDQPRPYMCFKHGLPCTPDGRCDLCRGDLLADTADETPQDLRDRLTTDPWVRAAGDDDTGALGFLPFTARPDQEGTR